MGGIQQREDQLNSWLRQSGLNNFMMQDPYGTGGADRIRALFGQFGGTPTIDQTPMMQAQNITDRARATSPGAAGRYGDLLQSKAMLGARLGTGANMQQLLNSGRMSPAALLAASGRYNAQDAASASGAYGQGFGMGMNELGRVDTQNLGIAQQNAQFGQQAGLANQSALQQTDLANQQARMQALGMQWNSLDNMQNQAYGAASNVFNTGLGNALNYINSRQTPINRGFSSWGPQVGQMVGRGIGGYLTGGMGGAFTGAFGGQMPQQQGYGQQQQPSGPGSTGYGQYSGGNPVGTNINDPMAILRAYGLM